MFQEVIQQIQTQQVDKPQQQLESSNKLYTSNIKRSEDYDRRTNKIKRKRGYSTNIKEWEW